MLILRLSQPSWFRGDADAPTEHCAHGEIEFAVNGRNFVTASQGPWTVSAAALFLLRTVCSDHTPENPVTDGNFLIPCCGHNVWPDEGSRYHFIIPGCNSGMDPSVVHQDGSVTVTLNDDTEFLPSSTWAAGVLRFSEQVRQFYASSAPKTPIEDEHDARGWRLFWKEWDERRELASNIANGY